MKSIPKDFLRALQQSGLGEFFVECPYVHRTDYVRWITGTKRPATRRRRIQKAIIRLFSQWREEMNVARATFAATDQIASATMDDRVARAGADRRSL
jgi:hypothetical protein